jgi:hypothetical protein
MSRSQERKTIRSASLATKTEVADDGDRGEKPPTIPLGETRAQSGKSRLKDGCSQDWLPHKDAVFHGISRAEGPSQQGRKTTPGGRCPLRLARTASRPIANRPQVNKLPHK